MCDYVPVPGDVYGNYELAALRKSKMRFVWRAGEGLLRVRVATPLYIRKRQSAEYFVLRALSGVKMVVRLDRIVRTQMLDGRYKRRLQPA